MRKRALTILCVLICIYLCSCKSKVPTAEKIKDDINSVYSDLLMGYQVEKVSIERSQTETKAYDADITFTGTDVYSQCEGNAHVKYGLYDGGKWMIDDFLFEGLDIKVTKYPSEEDIIKGFDDVPSLAECLLRESGVGERGMVNNVQIVEYNQTETGADAIADWVYSCGDITLSLRTYIAYGYSAWGWQRSFGDTVFRYLGDFQFTGIERLCVDYSLPVAIWNADLSGLELNFNGNDYHFVANDYMATNPAAGTAEYREWYPVWRESGLKGNAYIDYKLVSSDTGEGIPFMLGFQCYGTSMRISLDDYSITSIRIRDEKHLMDKYIFKDLTRGRR